MDNDIKGALMQFVERRGGDVNRVTLNTRIIEKLTAGEDELPRVNEVWETSAQT